MRFRLQLEMDIEAPDEEFAEKYGSSDPYLVASAMMAQRDMVARSISDGEGGQLRLLGLSVVPY